MRNVLVLIAVCCFSTLCIAQKQSTLNQLTQKHQQAPNDSLRIAVLEELADYYYTFRADTKGDSIVQIQLDIAEHSENKNLRLFALFGNAVANVNPWSTADRFKKTLQYIDQGLQYAEKIGNTNYVTLAHIRKANVYRKKGELNKAIEEANLAFLSFGNAPADSLKAILYLELGDIYNEKKDAVAAYKCFINAFQISYALKDLSLQSAIYHYLAKFYNSIGEKDLAKDQLKKSLDINKKLKNDDGVWLDNLELAKITDEKTYFEKTLEVATRLNSEKKILQSKYLMLAYYQVVDTNYLAMKYLKSNPDLEQYYLNQGIGNYYFTLGNIYHYDRTKRHSDSAVYYYVLAEQQMKSIYDRNTLRSIYRRLGESYAKQNNVPKAIECYEKALDYARQIGDIKPISDFILELSKLYAATNNLDNAYRYQLQFNAYRDSLIRLTNSRQLVFLEIEKESAKRVQDEKDLALQMEKTRNLQYMGITIAIAVVFIGMLLIGMFPISKFTIRALSFFAFICLFEFIIVMIDGYLHHKFHGDTLSIWLTKIVIIALLLPLHHYLEHWAVHFLESKKLQRLREKLSVQRWWRRGKTTLIKIDSDVKEEPLAHG